MKHEGLPARKLCILSCGHKRKIMDPLKHDLFYCMTCDDYLNVKAVRYSSGRAQERFVPFEEYKNRKTKAKIKASGLTLVE